MLKFLTKFVRKSNKVLNVRQSVDDLQDSNKVCQKVAKGAERAVLAEAVC